MTSLYAAGGVVLVGVDADGPLALACGGGLEGAATGAAGGLVDHVGASSSMPSAAALPLAGLPKPSKSGGWVRYLRLDLDAGLVSLTPAVKPASNFLISGISTPPMKPTLPVLVLRAAATPAR